MTPEDIRIRDEDIRIHNEGKAIVEKNMGRIGNKLDQELPNRGQELKASEAQRLLSNSGLMKQGTDGQRLLGGNNFFQRLKSGLDGGSSKDGLLYDRSNAIAQAIKTGAKALHKRPELKTPEYIELFNPAAQVQNVAPALNAISQSRATVGRNIDASTSDPNALNAAKIQLSKNVSDQQQQLFAAQRQDARQAIGAENARTAKQAQMDAQVREQTRQLQNNANIANAKETNQLINEMSKVGRDALIGNPMDRRNWENVVQQHQALKQQGIARSHQTDTDAILADISGLHKQQAAIISEFATLEADDPRREELIAQNKELEAKIAEAKNRIPSINDRYRQLYNNTFEDQQSALAAPNRMAYRRTSVDPSLMVSGTASYKKGAKLSEREKLEKKKELARYKQELKNAEEHYKQLSKNTNLVAKLMAKYALEDQKTKLKMHEMTMKSLYS